MKTLGLTFFLVCALIISSFAQNTKLDSLLFDAVKANDLAQVKKLVKQGADVNATDENGASVLYVAIQKSSPKIINILKESKANLKTPSQILTTSQGHTSGVNVLSYSPDGTKFLSGALMVL